MPDDIIKVELIDEGTYSYKLDYIKGELWKQLLNHLELSQ
jgi:hypothetical protein